MIPNGQTLRTAWNPKFRGTRSNSDASEGTWKGSGSALTLTALLIYLSTSVGCATNHSFPRGAALDVPHLVSELEAQAEDDEALFEFTYLPLLHLDLQTFAKTDEDQGYPDGHQFVSIRSWLPAFLIVDGEVEFFDTKQAVYERNEFTALLWGLWARNELTIQTRQGERVERNARLLWLLDWEDSVEYAQP